ncbi:MAG: InlB B-repeat-containing protein [Candidatus Sumerlaeia bacterium]
MRRLIFASLLLLFASAAQAATTNISGGGTGVLSAAIAAAASGDTINITDSATYTETSINLTKVIYLTADSGQTPVITNAGALVVNPAYKTFFTFFTGSGATTAAAGSKIGSLSGGQITIEYQTQASPAATDAIFRFVQGDAKYATLENLKIIETGVNPPINVIMHNNGSTPSGSRCEFIKLSYLDVDMNANEYLGTTNAATFIMSGYGDKRNYVSSNYESYLMDHVRVRDFGHVGISLANARVTVNMSYCDFGTLGATSNLASYPLGCVQAKNNYTNFTGAWDHCVFRAGAKGSAVQIGGGSGGGSYAASGSQPYTSLTLTRCLFLSKYPGNPYVSEIGPSDGNGYGTVMIVANTGSTWTAGYPQRIHFDHCDMVDLTEGTYANVGAFVRPNLTANVNAGTSLTITNCNLYSKNNAAFVKALATYPLVYNETNNNFYGATASTDGFTTGPADLNLDPGYLYPEAGDVRYSNTTVKTGDVYGGPIGIDAGYDDVVSESIQTKIGVRYAANPVAGGTIDSVTSTTYNINSGDSCPAKTAAVNAHYTWGGWSDGNMSLARPADTGITSSKIFKANFIIDTYTVNYAAGANGEVTGTLTQVIGWNETGSAVTALPSEGYHFTQWEDALTSNPRTDYNVTANATHTASFAINTYNYSYVAGANGTVNGAASVTGTADHGASGPSVTAAGATGFHFVKWLDNDSTNPTRQDVLTADLATTATFEADAQVTLTYTAGANGTITGTTPQTVSAGGSGTEVVAVPNTGYHFVDWSDGVLTAARTDTNVTANISVTANFAINTYTLTYTAGTNGSITGTTPQTVNHGASGSEVTAVANSGYHFVQWSDGVLTAARTDTNVTGNITVSASFASDSPAVSSIKVPTDYSTIQAAINAAEEGGTVEIVNSATYKENLRINKSVNLIATAGQNPKIEQLDNSTTCPVILGVTASPSIIQLGSISGGRLTFQYLKWGISTGGVMPVGQIYMGVTTGSTVRIENCDIMSTGTNTYTPVTGIAHHQNPCSVTVRYTNIDCNRGSFDAGGVSSNRGGCTGIDISNNSPTGGATITRRIPGPSYTLDHVRIKGYVRAGLWLHYTSMTLTASNIDVGTYGENTVAGSNIPWGPIISFNAAATWTGRIDHSLFQGPLNYAAFGKVGPRGTSVTLSRSVVLGSGGTNASYGALDCSTQTNQAGAGNPIQLTIDHCDLVHLGNAPASALSRALNVAEINLSVSNSNIYSLNGQAMNLVYIASPSTFASSNNNVYGAVASVGNTVGTGDLSMDPGYTNPATGDVRYSNTTLRRSDSTGGPIGVNSDYTDVFNIVEGDNTSVNRAHGWTLMK